MHRPSLSRPLRGLAWLAGLIAIAGASLVSAQPAPSVSPPAPTPLPPPEDTPAVPPPVGPAPLEEAPPVNVPPPAPILVPPISEKEVVAALGATGLPATGAAAASLVAACSDLDVASAAVGAVWQPTSKATPSRAVATGDGETSLRMRATGRQAP